MKKATKQQTRRHNTQLILRTLFEQGPLSRADISRLTHLTRPTVSDIIELSAQDGYVVEVGRGESAAAGGKPPRMLAIEANARQMLCLDLSGDNIYGAVVNLQGEITYRLSWRWEGRQGEAAIAFVSQMITTLAATATAPLLGISVGTPGLVNPHNGTVQEAINLGWHNVPLQTRLKGSFACPIYIINDSRAAALGEYNFGPYQGIPSLICIKIAQGIGAGIVLDGHPFYGDSFGAGEIGQVIMREPVGQPPQTLENIASARAILQHYRQLARREQADWSELVQAFAEGQEAAQTVAYEAAYYLGISLSHLVAAFNISTIVLSGIVCELDGNWLQKIEETLNQKLFPSLAAATSITYSSLNRDNVLLGCSAILLQQELGIIK